MLIKILFGGLIFGCLAANLSALDPKKSVNQFNREIWDSGRGFSFGTVYAFAQTNDGFLWIGTEKGLIRFDGKTFETIRPENTALAFAEPVLGLVTDAEGTLWIRLRSPKILCYKNGKFEDAWLNLSEVDPRISSMSRNQKGELLLSTLENGPLKYFENGILRLLPKSELPSSFLISVAETNAGEIWMGTREAGLYRFDGQKTTEIKNNLPDRKINSLLSDIDGKIWIGTDHGIAFWNGKEIEIPNLPENIKKSQILTMIKDRHGNLWLGTKADGIAKINSNGKVSVENFKGDSPKIITTLLEDREGNIWVGTQFGIERLRDSSFITYSTQSGFPSDASGAIYVDAHSKLWFAPLGGGLFWMKDEKIEKVSGLENEIIYSVAGNENGIWVGRQKGGLTHLALSEDGGKTILKTYTEKEGLPQNSIFSVFVSRNGAIWAGTLSGGVSRLQDGKFTNFTTNDGLISNTVNQISESADGTIWLATPNGINFFSQNEWKSLSIKQGLPSDSVNCLLERKDGGLWIGTNKGLAFYDGQKVLGFSEFHDLPQEPIYGLAEDKNGNLWISSANRILQIDGKKLITGNLAENDLRGFGISEGLLSVEGVKRSLTAIADSRNRIWFSLVRGISMIEATELVENSNPALLKINYLAADGTRLNLNESLQISAAHQRITFGFTAISLEIPENVKYRYKLENFDNEWSNPTTDREAVYTNLSPGVYRFRVIASNSYGVWNSGEVVTEFKILPLFWQTWWFRFLCLAVLFLLVLALFKFREYRITKVLTLRFEERLAERTLLAQDLHDSLLQGVVGTSIQLNVLLDQTPENSSAKQALIKILHSIERVVAEGRNTIRGLRAVNESKAEAAAINLEDSLAEIWQNFAGKTETDFRIVINGERRSLHPLVKTEVQRVGGEALINAIKHSKAKKIEVEIDYGAKLFKMSVCDDGCGFDLPEEFESHWGILGMRERAERIGAKLNISSHQNLGTRVEIIVAGKIAFEKDQADKKNIDRLLKIIRVRKSE